jgi:hypothetical protein
MSAIDEIDVDAPGGWHCRMQAQQEAIQARGGAQPDQPQEQEEVGQ